MLSVREEPEPVTLMFPAMLGTSVEVETLDGKASMKVPPGTQGGQKFRLRAKGVPPQKDGEEPGDLYVTVQLLSHDAKRLHIFTIVHRSDDDTVVATAEHMMLHVDASAGKSSPASPAIQAVLADIAAHHDALPRPTNAGRSIGQPRA